jgi:small subunit ribosomal protein S2
VQDPASASPQEQGFKEGPINMATVDVDIKKLLEAGAHFGHKTSRWHPKMAPFIHSKRNGTHIIDLTKTVEHLEIALKFIEDTTAEGKQILVVGTKRQAHDIALKLAQDTKMPFVVERWLGGMMTNRATIGARVKRLQDLESKMENGQLANKYSKLEVQRLQEEIDRLNHIYGGIKHMAARPGAVFIFDVTHDTNAVREARKLGVPVVALVDTNADPTDIQYPIPANDDAIKALQLIAEYVQAAIEAGAAKYAAKADKGADKTDKEEK